MLEKLTLAGSPPGREERPLENQWRKSSLDLWESDTFCESADTFVLNCAWTELSWKANKFCLSDVFTLEGVSGQGLRCSASLRCLVQCVLIAAEAFTNCGNMSNK